MEQRKPPDSTLPGRPGAQGKPESPPGKPDVLPPDQPGHPGKPPQPPGRPETPGAHPDNTLPKPPERPDNTLPEQQPRPDNTLPGQQPRPDNTLPEQQPRPDNTLPETPDRPDNTLPRQRPGRPDQKPTDRPEPKRKPKEEALPKAEPREGAGEYPVSKLTPEAQVYLHQQAAACQMPDLWYRVLQGSREEIEKAVDTAEAAGRQADLYDEDGNVGDDLPAKVDVVLRAAAREITRT